MLVSKEVFNRLQPGDYVKVKSLGQLIDTGWIEMNGVYIHERSWAGVVPDVMNKHLGQLCQVRTIAIHPITGDLYVTLEEDELELYYTIEMMYELYPLVRGLV